MKLETLFPQRLYVELQRHGLAKEREVEGGLIEFAYDRGLPLVATNEPYFAALSDYEAHDALICIAEGAVIGQAERRQLSPEHRFKTRAEMLALFADLPEATASTIEIARRCAYRPRTRKPILPAFTTGAAADEAAELVRQAEEGLTARLEARGMAPGLEEQVYRDRLAFELTVIANMKFPGYFLIVADFIKWAKDQGIPVGPGRGSGAGSLRRLRAHHHRSRSPAVRPPLRTLPQSRTHLDAGLRHRLLPGPARRGDPLRARPLRRRQGGADHHFRLVPRTRRAAQRRPRAGDAAGPGRQAGQAGAAEPGGAGDAQAGDRRGGPPAGGGRGGAEGRAVAGDLADAGGFVLQRLDPCRRHRYRRPPTRRVGAALPRSEIRHAGDSVQHEMG